MKLKDVLDLINSVDVSAIEANIQTYNALAQAIRIGVAEVLAERLSQQAGEVADVDAETLPLAKFEDTPQTRKCLQELMAGAAISFYVHAVQTPFGPHVEGVAIHPQAIILHARATIEKLGEESVNQFGQDYNAGVNELAKVCLSAAVLNLLATGTLWAAKPGLETNPELIERVVTRASQHWRK